MPPSKIQAGRSSAQGHVVEPPVSVIAILVGPGLYYGDHDHTENAGIVFQFDVTNPAPGDLGLIQLVNAVRINNYTDGTSKTQSTIGASVLDTSDETSPFFENEIGDATTIPIVNQVSSAPPGDDHAYSDSPGQGVFSTLQSLSLNDSFQTYLMYRPSTGGSIWVTLNVLN
jgi:hypothetical protein